LYPVSAPADSRLIMKILTVQHVAQEGAGRLRPYLEHRGWHFDLVCMDQPKAKLPVNIDEFQALLVLGGPMGAYEEERYPYLVHLQNLIRDALQRQLPVVGICLGAQLIARSLGGVVERNPVSEIGWRRVSLTAEGRKSLLFCGVPDEIMVFQWHSDTFHLPADASLLAVGEQCVNQAMAVGSSWSLQFHPEITIELITEWMELYRDELEEINGPGAVDEILTDSRKFWPHYQDWQARVFENLANILTSSNKP